MDCETGTCEETATTGCCDTEKTTDPIMQFFCFKHLPDDLQRVSMPFCTLAQLVCETIPRNAERTVTLRKLLESKDACVRAVIAK